MRPARSYLFVPADRPERVAKALASGADAVIVDLEDAVAADGKDAAREAAAGSLHAGNAVVVRVNAADTPWFDADVQLCRMQAVAAVVLPKTHSAAEVIELRARLARDVPILPLIESARGMWNAHAIAAADGVQRLLFGTIDFQLEMQIHGAQQELDFYRAQLVLASRVAGIQAPVDGPSVMIDAPQELRCAAARARRHGFGGKLCIHPAQVAVVNECFGPSALEVEWAQRVLAAADAAAGAVAKVDGEMVDRPVVERATQILRTWTSGG
jgi:citrate lyase subunit beta/citryl-CoA lyase